jgi:hypothetical protein
MSKVVVDLPVDLGSEDDSGLPWGLLDEAQDILKMAEGAWIIVGSAHTQAVAQVNDISDSGVVHVRPLPGSVASHADLLNPAA